METFFEEFISGEYPTEKFPGQLVSNPQSSVILSFPATTNDIFFGSPVSWNYSSNNGIKLSDSNDFYVFGVACHNRNRAINRKLSNGNLQTYTFKIGEMIPVLIFGAINMLNISSINPLNGLRIIGSGENTGLLTTQAVPGSLDAEFSLSPTEPVSDNSISTILVDSKLGRQF